MNEVQTELVSTLIMSGDISRLSPQQKLEYYTGYCKRIGLDPFSKPFEFLKLNGREILYCTRSGAQQLNKLHNVSHIITSREMIEAAGVFQVTARATLPDGRCSESIGAVNIGGLKGDAYANAVMKAETKAKRRATLDLLGLGVLDETEVESIPNAKNHPRWTESEKMEKPMISAMSFRKALDYAYTDPTIYERTKEKYGLTEEQDNTLRNAYAQPNEMKVKSI